MLGIGQNVNVASTKRLEPAARLPDPLELLEHYRERLTRSAEEVEDLREHLQDATDRRNAIIIEALDSQSVNARQVAAWTQLSRPMISRIMATA